jgi:CRP-like cAMP-binding protein
MQFQFPYFENLCPSWENIAHLGFQHIFQKGSQIIGLETPVDGVYYVKEGVVEILLYTSRGPEKVLFYVGSGCIFGEVSCFAKGGNNEEASVKARTDCILYFFSRDQLEGTIASQYPHLLIELIRASAYKIRMYGVLLQDSLTGDHFTRVCKMLVYLVRFKGVETARGPKQVTVRPDLTQNDIARLLGIHRVTVTKSISRLKEMGILRRFSKKSLEIADFPALLDLIEKEST